MTSVEPVVQADPTEQAIPSRSSAIATDAPSVSRAIIERRPGSRSVGWPVSSVPVDRRGPPSGVARAGGGARSTVSARSRARKLVGRGQPDRAGDVLRPGAAMPLLAAALLLGQDVRAVADVQGADALRSLELVSADREQVDAERLDVEVDLRRRLDRVDVRRGRRDAPGRARAISAIGWIVPTSLFASMIETRIVRSVIAASSWSGSTRP